MELYALVTAARNEERYIEKTLKSVTSQTTLPCKWVIVSDGSTDGTEEIVRRYATKFKFIHLLCRAKDSERDFASKVFALNAGMQLIGGESFEFVGHLDADVSFKPDYFRDLFRKFQDDPALGVAGGFIYEDVNGQFISRKGNRTSSVAGAVQMFRRECYQEIGPFLPIQYGGEDWYAEVAARMRGWRVESFPELEVRHHRPTGSVGGLLRSWYREGIMDYSIGSHPVFEFTKLTRRICYRPFLLGSLTRFTSFILASLRREKRIVSPEFVSFLRKEEIGRLRAIGHRYLSGLED
ncbi:MAG: glycosyltransferase family A protein [Acidobacteriota bacterium]